MSKMHDYYRQFDRYFAGKITYADLTEWTRKYMSDDPQPPDPVEYTKWQVRRCVWTFINCAAALLAVLLVCYCVTEYFKP